jgi:hypothetical protein
MAAVIAEFGAWKTSYSVGIASRYNVVPTVAATTTDTNASAVVTAATSIPGTTPIDSYSTRWSNNQYGFNCLDIDCNE